MKSSINPNTNLTPRDLIERAARGEPAAVAKVTEHLENEMVINALQDFLRDPVSRAVKRFWKGRSAEVRYHVNAEEAAEDVITNVIIRIRASPALLADGRLVGYAWIAARNYVRDENRRHRAEADALGRRSSMTVAELRAAALDRYADQREHASRLLTQISTKLGPARYLALVTHAMRGRKATRAAGATDGELSNSRRTARRVMAEQADILR